MSDKRGIFSLDEFYDLQVSGETSKILDVFRYVNSLATSGGPAYGYWGGGIGPSNLSSVDRIDYTNDATNMVTKGPLTEVGYYLVGISSPSYGYTCGNLYPGYKSTVQRADYANDTATAVVKGPLTRSDGSASGLNSRSYGYFAGGQNPGNNSYVDRIDFSNDSSTASPKGNLDTGRGKCAGTSNQSYGWATGGIEPGTTKVSRIDFSNDTATSSPKGEMVTARMGHSGSGNADYGYQAGGNNNYKSSVDRIDYSNDTATAVEKGPLSIGRRYVDGVSSPSYGWHAGGETPTKISTCDRIDYSNDTATAVVKGSLTSAKAWFMGNHSAQSNDLPGPTGIAPATRVEAGMTPVPNFGYFAGGMWPVVSTIDRIDYANDTATAAVKGPLDRDLLAQQSTSNSTHGYFAGGEPSGTSKVSRMEFSNDTATTSPKGPLSAVQKYFGAAGNLSFGYYAGNSPSTISTVSRIDYSNDTATALAKGPLSFAKGHAQGCGNLSFGYFAGGNGNKSSVDRIDYSNDTATASAKGPLENSRSTMAASGTSDFGYWSGGYPYYTKASRIDYSNDTATAVAKAPYPSTVTPYGFSNSAGTGNSTHGYAAGGNGYNSYVWRIDYSNDTANGVEKGSLSQGRLRLSGVSPLENALPSKEPGPVDKGADGYISQSTSGNSTYPYGYVAGGDPTKSSIDRIDFGNDSATATPKGNLTQARYNYNQSVASPSHGYVMGGYGVAPEPNGNASSIDRIDFSNDTATAPSVANINNSPGLYSAGATGNNDYAYIGGGAIHPGGIYSTIRRFDFSSDTTNTVDKSTLHANINFHTATGNLSYGYFGGYPSKTLVDRLDYSNDTAASSPKGPLVMTWRLRASVGNQSYGYFTGGQNPSNPSGYNSTNVERIDYSNDTATASSRGPMAGGRYLHATSGSGQYGYNSGGRQPTEEGSSVDRIDYANDTSTPSPRGNMSYKTKSWSGLSSQEDGKQSFTSGFIPRIRWVDSVAEAPAGSVAPGHAYFGGGGPSPSGKTIVDRLDFSNDSAAMAPKGSLSQSRKQLTAVGSPSYAYMMGGYDANASPGYELSYIDRIDYASDTSTATPKGLLAEGTYYAGATGTASYGYNGGGQASSGVVSCTVQRIDYSNDTATASPKGYLTIRRRNFAGCVGNTSYGYWSGGENNVSTWISTTERVDFSNDTAAATVKGPVDGPVRGNADGTGNANYGYYAGGYYPDSPAPAHRYSIVSRIDFSSDTGTIPTKAALSASLSAMGAAGNASYGYWGAGADDSGLKTSVDRIDFSNDTSTPTVVTAYLSDARAQAGAASGLMYGLPQTASAAIAAPVQPPFPYPEQLYNPASNKLHGYIGGGSPGPLSSVDRITFANDTATATPKGSLTATKYRRGGTGNVNYGYIGAGRPGPISIVDRIDYTNDTATATAKGPLSSARAGAAAVGNANYGYWFGGNNPGYTTRVDRLDFASDSSAAVTKGSLTAVRGYGSAVGNQNYGYHCGGTDGNPQSNIDRVDYSSDTPTMSPKGQLSFSQSSNMADFSNSNYGWLAGRSPGPSRSIIDRVDFSNDTGTTPARGPLTENRARATGTGDSNYGYACGGMPEFSRVSKVERVDYSNDTATASPKGNLTSVRADAGGVSAGDNGL